MKFLTTVRRKSEKKPNCACEHIGHITRGGCRINEPAPPGYKCRCTSDFLWTCGGRAYKCDFEGQDFVVGCNGCTERECCTGNCNGYNQI